jgi:hypothetical protein
VRARRGPPRAHSAIVGLSIDVVHCRYGPQ